jgi:hypothetical protein
MYELFINARTWAALILVVVLTYKLWKCVTCLCDADQPTMQRADIQLGPFPWMNIRNLKDTFKCGDGWRFWISLANDKRLAALTLIFSRQLINECNRNCSCDNLKYTPVCSKTNDMTYYSACHAGCGYMFNNSQVSLRLGIMQQTAAEGLYSLLSFIMHYK